MLASGFGIGVVVAAQVGPVTLLIVRTVLRGGRAVAVGLAMAAAVALVDLLYAGVGLAGVGRLLSDAPLRLAFGVVSAAILIAIGVRTRTPGCGRGSGSSARRTWWSRAARFSPRSPRPPSTR